MPLRKSKDKEVQPAQADHADDSPLHSEGENDPITFLPVSPLAERSYGNPVFKEKEADHGGDFAKSSNMFRGMMDRLDIAFKEKNQTMQRLVESQAKSARRQEEIIRQCIEEMRRVFEKGTRVMQETGEESCRPLQAVSEQVVEQVRQPRPEIPPPVVEIPRQIQEAPIPALGGQGNQPYPNIQQQHFVIGEGQRQHQLMEAATPVADHGHQPQHKYILLARKGNVGPCHQPCPRDFFQPQVPPVQPVRRSLQNQPAQFFNKDHGPSLRPLEKIDKNTLRFPDKAKETMGVDADPFPAVSVGVNVADLMSVAKNHNLPHTHRNLAAEDLRWVLEAQRSRHSRSVRSDQQKLGGQGRITVTRNFSPEGARRYSTGTRSPRMVKPPLKSPSKRWEKVNHPKFPAQNPKTLRRRLQRKRAEERKRHQKQVEAEGRGVNHSRGVLPVELTVGNRTLMSAFFVVDTVATYNALLGRDWIHSSWCVPSSLHQKLIFWNGGKAEVVSADDKPFSASTHLVEARYYEEDIGTIRFFGMDRHGKPIGITACSRPSLSKRAVEEQARLRHEREKAVLEITKKLAAYFAEKAVQVDRSAIVHEGEEADQGDEITLEELDLAPAKLDDLKAEVQDQLEEINLGSESEPKDYSEMPGLDRKLVEHKLPIAEGFRPYKQPPRHMSADVTLKVKKEIERLVKVGFIRTCRYADWLSNVVPVLKKNGKLRVYVDFRNLNLATPKDEYPMPIADLLIDGVAHHKILSFMDGHSGYNQIFIADADIPKTAFRCPAMNAIFHDMIGKFMEIYIDDVVVKSNGEADHLVHLRKSFERMRQHGLKMNPLKCAFGVSAGNFLGYLVHERGLEVDKNKARAVIEVKPPQNKKELQRFLGQVNFLRRFISNLAWKTRGFSPLLKLKSEVDFKWEEHHQSAFDMIKRYLSRPPVLVPPVKNKPLILYISTADESIRCLLAQENDKKQEHAVYYLSRCLTQTEVKYSSVEKLCLALFFAAIKLRHYLIYSKMYVVAKTDIVKYMLSRPLLRGRIGKWILALSEFNLKYIPQRAVKGQALADFLADHPCLDVEADEDKGINLFSISLVPWKLIFDGSSTETMSGVGVVVISPSGLKTHVFLAGF
ncbi:hypothetical protein SLEP1_g43756 [Rubroshorea leprosula]|uniref:Reverse transcriptase n=1 Tax=Rubroshorea leprosula TaxID=152421 RepID=A0AAV5LF17_9ROSI|nr:hypothetical protein SLEP1_g43756 [Rubroshorea leprosula]